MKKKLFTGLIVGVFALCSANIGHGTLLVNGSFDTKADIIGNINTLNLNSLAAGQWDVFNSLPGWTKGVGTSGIEIQYNTIIDAYSPGYYVELDSHGGTDTNSSMFQSVTFTDVGWYELSFMYYARTNNLDDDNGIEGFFDGISVGSVSKKKDDMGPTNWEKVTWSFEVVNAGAYAISFAAYGNDNSLGGFVDSVSLSPVPEPATMLLFGAGLAGLAGARARRKKK